MQTTTTATMPEQNAIPQTGSQNSTDTKMGALDVPSWNWENITDIAKPAIEGDSNPLFTGYIAQIWVDSVINLMGIDVSGRVGSYYSGDGINWSSFFVDVPPFVQTGLGSCYINNNLSLPAYFVIDFVGTLWCCYRNPDNNGIWSSYPITGNGLQLKIAVPMGILLIDNVTTLFAVDSDFNLWTIKSDGGATNWSFSKLSAPTNSTPLRSSFGTATIDKISGTFGLDLKKNLQFVYTNS